MIQKEKYNVKRVLALILPLACVTGLLAGCARQNTGEGKAEGSSSEEPSFDTWYEADQEAGILTVRLPVEKEGFIWDFTIDDTTLLELVTEEDDNGTFVASFRALGDGETVVSFTYARDDALEEIRTLNDKQPESWYNRANQSCTDSCSTKGGFRNERSNKQNHSNLLPSFTGR